MNDANGGLLRSNLTVALGTALSRVTGLIRVTAFAIVLGQSALADAYNSANGSPNAIYELLLGGVLSSSLVPLFTRHVKDGDDEATSAVITVAVMALTAVTALAVIAAPWIFHLFSVDTPNGVDAEIYRRAGTTLTRVFLLQIFFYGLSALGNALLQARRRFFAAAWAPVLSNVVIIISMVFVAKAIDTPSVEVGDVLVNTQLRYMLWLGATLGIAVMAVALLPALRRADVRLHFRPDFKHESVRQLLRLSGWTLGYVIANQVSIIVVQNLALSTGEGRQDAYVKAFTFFVLPHGLLGVTIATTFAPELARSVLKKNRERFLTRASLGIRLVALLTLPAGFGLFVLRQPIVGAMLQHGKFEADDTLVTSRALAGFALGLVGFSVYLFVLRCFYAHSDARTPFVINLGENLINIVLAIVLVNRYGVLGLGVAFALAYLVSALWSMLILSYKVPGLELRPLFASLYRMLLASVVMAEVCWLVARLVGSNVGLGALVRVSIAGIVGTGVYVAMLVVLKAPEWTQLVDKIQERRARRVST